MRFGMLLGVAGALAFGGFEHRARTTVAAPIACESLAEMQLTNTTFTSVASVPAGAFTPPTARQCVFDAGIQERSCVLSRDGAVDADT